MFELNHIAETLMDIVQTGVFDFVIPKAGVGGGIEVRESIDVVTVLKDVAVFVAAFAAIFGVGLAMAAQKFSVKIDPRIEKVKDVLAGAHCGACGYPGCEQYAEAVVNNADVPPNLCTPGGSRALEAVARITNKVAEKTDPLFSRIMCQGGLSNAQKRFTYEGVRDCRAAVLAGGGDKACIYGCLGYGTCVTVCPFDAIHMGDNGLPVVDMGKCTGCRKCEVACPKKVIEVLPAGKAVLVACHSKDKGGDARKHCEMACIACGKCVKVCPYDAPSIANNLSTINIAKCQVCGLCVSACPTKAIVDMIPARPKAHVTDRCIGCHKCAKICPVDAPSGEQKERHVIDTEKCIGCGICTANCPKQAIEGTFNFLAIWEAAEAKRAEKDEVKKAIEEAV